MEEIIKQSTDLYYEIDDCITTMLKARLDKNVNKEHESFCKMESLIVETMQHISWLVGELKDNSKIKWQTGEPKESGSYLVTIKCSYDTFVTCSYYSCLNGWSHWEEEEIIAWCKLRDIESYKEEPR